VSRNLSNIINKQLNSTFRRVNNDVFIVIKLFQINPSHHALKLNANRNLGDTRSGRSERTQTKRPVPVDGLQVRFGHRGLEEVRASAFRATGDMMDIWKAVG
jgi:hypothetical protein